MRPHDDPLVHHPRFLARLFLDDQRDVVLKGGLVLEMRTRWGTHPVPVGLPDEPLAWAPPYADLARRDGLAWTALETVTAAARAFDDPILGNAPVVAGTPGEGWG